MPHPVAAMLRSPSSILRLSRHLRCPGTPRFPSPSFSARCRFLSSSSSSPPDGVGWTSYDPFTDTLAPAAAAPSASASDSETPTKSGAWGVYDPVAGRIVMQSASSNSGNDDEEVDKAEEQKGKRTRSGGKGRAGSSAVAATPSSTDSDSYDEEADGEEKGKRTQSGGMVQDSWSAIAVPRKAAGKAGKQRGSYVCSGCGKAQSQWWGICPHCEAVGTLNKFVHGADPGSTGGSHHAVRSWIPQKSKEMVPQSLHDVNKGFDQAEWRIPLYVVYVFALLVGRGYLGWRSLGCLVAALFQVNQNI